MPTTILAALRNASVAAQSERVPVQRVEMIGLAERVDGEFSVHRMVETDFLVAEATTEIPGLEFRRSISEQCIESEVRSRLRRHPQ